MGDKAAASKPPEAAPPLSKTMIFATSGLGGIFGWIVVHPFNTLAVRMNLANMAGGPPRSFGAFTKEIVSSEGVGSLYAGLGAGCLRQVFYATARLGLFDTFRDALKSEVIESRDANRHEVQIKPTRNLLT